MRIQPLCLVALFSVGCANDDPDTTAQELSTFQQAVEAVGGEDTLRGLNLLQIEATGERWIDYESPQPGRAEELSSYTTSYKFDLSSDHFRADTERVPLFEALEFFPPASYGIVINGDVGGLTAQAGFAPPGSLPSQNVASLRTEQRLLNPHFYLRDGLADPSLIHDDGNAEVGGKAHRIILFSGESSEIRLFIDEQSGLISKLETLANNILVRDFRLEVRYLDWQSKGTLAFPGTVELYADGLLMLSERRTEVKIDPSFAEDTFDLPPGAVDPMVDAEAFSFGETSHLVSESFFHLGFPYVEETSTKTTQLAPGVTLLGEGAANSLVVEYDQGLVLFEAPQTPKHGSNLVDAIAAAFPGRPITHIVQSHYHQDHGAGVRSLVAAGASVVVASNARQFWDRVLSAKSSIRPDALSASSVTPSFNEVPLADSYVIQDANITMTVHHLGANPHADDMLITVIDSGGQRFVFEADLYNAGFGVTLVLGGPESFFAGLRDLGILDTNCDSTVPLTIIPVHGAPHSLADSLTELNSQSIDVGCP